jgi:tRNA threonylcarbamoyl adenosine modification protein (Sua5/YciO/YrdC/YwlC family)
MSDAFRPVDRDAIERAVDVLAAGGLVAVPTETVYGLAADADSRAAVRAIFEAKGRPADHPVIVHVANLEALDAWASRVPAQARALAQRFWPGPLTLVLPRAARAHDGLTGGQDTVGLRCPAHPWAHALLAAWCARRSDAAAALAAPSANSFGRISPTTAAHVRADLGEKRSASSRRSSICRARRTAFICCGPATSRACKSKRCLVRRSRRSRPGRRARPAPWRSTTRRVPRWNWSRSAPSARA